MSAVWPPWLVILAAVAGGLVVTMIVALLAVPALWWLTGERWMHDTSRHRRLWEE